MSARAPKHLCTGAILNSDPACGGPNNLRSYPWSQTLESWISFCCQKAVAHIVYNVAESEGLSTPMMPAWTTEKLSSRLSLPQSLLALGLQAQISQKSPMRIPLLIVLALGSLVGGIFYWLSIAGPVDQCGTSAVEARARGCNFEVTSFSWLPRDCYNRQIDYLLEAEDIHYFRDENRTEEVDIAEVRQGEAHGYFVTPNYHKAHCSLLFLKLHMAMKQGGKIDGLIISLAHSHHCVQIVLSSPAEIASVPQYAFTKWPYCGREGGFNLHFHQQGQWTG